MTKVQRLEAENARLRKALVQVLEVCNRERHEVREWPEAVGAIAFLARTALTEAS